MVNHYERIATIYDATRVLPTHVSEQVTDCILRLTRASADTTFLELGIGTGRIAFPIVQRGYLYTGIDISGAMLDQLCRKLEAMSHHCTLIQADASSLEMLDSASFDVALSCHALHMLRSMRGALIELGRVLKSTGMYLHCLNELPRYHQKIDQQWQSIIFKLNPHFVRSPHYNMQQENLVELLTEWATQVQTIVAARWKAEQKVADVFAAYEAKAYSSCWTIDEDDFQFALRQLKRWCAENYGTADTVLSADTEFTIVVAWR